jgi:hypothetical protein
VLGFIVPVLGRAILRIHQHICVLLVRIAQLDLPLLIHFRALLGIIALRAHQARQPIRVQPDIIVCREVRRIL